jgi:uncharacterized coiled-coil DUF342 family protein
MSTSKKEEFKKLKSELNEINKKLTPLKKKLRSKTWNEDDELSWNDLSNQFDLKTAEVMQFALDPNNDEVFE